MWNFYSGPQPGNPGNANFKEFNSSLSIADIFADLTVFRRSQKAERAHCPHCVWLCFLIKLGSEVSIWIINCLARSRTLKYANYSSYLFF